MPLIPGYGAALRRLLAALQAAPRQPSPEQLNVITGVRASAAGTGRGNVGHRPSRREEYAYRTALGVAPELLMGDVPLPGGAGAARVARRAITDPRRLIPMRVRPAELTRGQLRTVTEGGRGREFAEQRYPTTADVRVHWDDPSDSIVDAVKGLNMGHALTRAGANWPTAKLIELLRATKTAAPTIAEKAAPLVPKSFGPLARTGPVTGAKQLLDRYELARLRGLVHPGAK